jgi:hypothetical protein
VAETPKALDPVDVMLDKKRRLRFTMGSLRRAQRRLEEIRGEKISIFELLSEKNKDKLSPDEIVVLFHQGLRADDPNLTEEQVEELIDVRELDALAEKLAQALGGQARPDGKEKEGRADASPLPPSPGSTSGPSGAPS